MPDEVGCHMRSIMSAIQRHSQIRRVGENLRGQGEVWRNVLGLKHQYTAWRWEDEFYSKQTAEFVESDAKEKPLKNAVIAGPQNPSTISGSPISSIASSIFNATSHLAHHFPASAGRNGLIPLSGLA